MFNNSFISLDTETTGLDPLRGNRIIEIGIVKCVNGVVLDNTFHEYLDPEGFKVEPGAFKVHGISDDFLINKPLYKDVYQKMIDFIGDEPVVIHNASFDMKFLAHESYKSNISLKWLEDLSVIDSLDYSRKNNKGRHNLDALADKYGIDRSDRTLHGAELDAKILAQVAQCMMGTPSQLSIFGAKDVFEVRKGSDYFNILGASTVNDNAFKYIPKELPVIDQESLIAHDALLTRIKEESGSCLWSVSNSKENNKKDKITPFPKP